MDSEDEEEEEPGLESITYSISSRKIWFYANVTPKSVLRLKTILDEMTLVLQKTSSFVEMEWIELLIHSNGGCFFAGMSGMEAIRFNEIPVHTIADGVVASAATFLCMAGRWRSSYPSSMFLIHSIRAHLGELSHPELTEEKENQDRMTSLMVSRYKEFSKIPATALRAMLNSELYIGSDLALRYGLVDEVIKVQKR